MRPRRFPLRFRFPGGPWIAAIALLSTIPSPPTWATTDAPTPRPQCFDGDAIATDANIRQDDLTSPSLWFTRDLFGRKVVHHWRVYGPEGPRSPQVDVVVNQQMWRTLEYLGQYDFLSEFGRVAHQYGYGVRICNFRGNLLGSHTCTSNGEETACQLYLPGGVSARSRPELFF